MKKTWVRKTLSVGVLAAGALLFAPAAAAQADVDQVTTYNSGWVNGTQLAVPVNVPVNLVGNSAGVLLGQSQSYGVGANHIEESGEVDQLSGRNNGILNGTQIAVPITVPINVTGNSLAVLGNSRAGGISSNWVESAKATESGCCDNDRDRGVGNVGQVSAWNNGILNGTQIAAPITVPINACGNSLALIGNSQATGLCSNHVGSRARKVWKLEGKKQNRAESFWDNDGVGNVDQLSFRNNGILNGTQIAAPITVPINACGNSLALLGNSRAFGACTNHVGDGFDRKRVRVVRPGDILGDGDCAGTRGHGVVKSYGCDDDGDVQGDNGYGGHKGDVRGDKGYGGHKGDKNDGYGKPAADTAPDGYGDEAPTQYGDDMTGRSAEKSPVSELTNRLGGVGGTDVAGLDLLDSLR
ncbi:chaplin family protein [Actinoplanes sp. NBC_00393]|uniref:chaplin family protein n=1 Tax=Actinoplanes sp. NBC_00393 TaxID=2975953 RepID=UPI002E1DA6A0